jgi:hypothetical protein
MQEPVGEHGGDAMAQHYEQGRNEVLDLLLLTDCFCSTWPRLDVQICSDHCCSATRPHLALLLAQMTLMLASLLL